MHVSDEHIFISILDTSISKGLAQALCSNHHTVLLSLLFPTSALTDGDG